MLNQRARFAVTLVLVLVLVLVLGLVVGLGSRSRASIIRQSIDTMRSSICFPCASSAALRCFRAASASRHAADSSADPRAISRNRQRSARERLPFPSAMLLATEWLASSWCFFAVPRMSLSEPSNKSPTHAMSSTQAVHVQPLVIERHARLSAVRCPMLRENDSEHEHEHEHEHDLIDNHAR